MTEKNFNDRWWTQPDGDAIQIAAADWFARLRNPGISPEETAAWQDWMEKDPRHAQAFARIEDAGSVLERLRPTRPLAWATSFLLKAFRRFT